MYYEFVAAGRIASASKPKLLKSALLGSLQSGNFRVGDRFPSEPELIARFGVSRATVREAIVSLEQDGWLKRLQGKGTFVNERPKTHRTIAVVAPYLYASDSPDFRAGADVIPLLMQSLEHHARQWGASLSLYLDNMDVATERENLQSVIERELDGVLIVYIGGRANLDCLRKLRSAGIPLVLIDRYVEEISADAVATDNRLGAYEATLRFLELGLPTVDYITCPIDSTTLRDRLQGYMAAMNGRGLEPRVHELEQEVGDGTDPHNYERTHALVRQIRFPTALFASDATRLALVANIVDELGVPRGGYALGCFDEPYLNAPEGVLLLRVLQPLRDIGRKAVELTLSRIEGKADPPVRLLLPPEILVTGAPTQASAGS